MGIKFFGQYLVEQKVVTREALQKAVLLQRRMNLLFGAAAKSMGLMTESDIERVHTAQREKDMNFGDLCVELGILTQDQVKRVAEMQKQNHLHLGDALVQTNAIKADALPGLLEAFEADQAPHYAKKELPSPVIPHDDLWQLYAERTYLMFTRVVNLTSKPDERSVVERIDPNDTVVAMHMTGDAPCTYLLSVSGSVRDSIARAMLKQDDVSAEPKEVRVDAVKEFTNIVCGSIAAKVMQMDKNIEFGSPSIIEAKDGYAPSPGGKGLLYPLLANEGRIEVGIFWE